RPSAYTASATEPPLSFRFSPPDKSNMARYLFGGFERCLYSVQKFHSEAERILAVILERDSLKWFKPAKGQFQIFYKQGADHHEYVPDFVAETDDMIYLLEPKAVNTMNDPIVLAKRDVAIKWCVAATTYAQTYGGKPWKYALIPHTAINESRTIQGLAAANL
ncbi:MAG: putative type restriction enzyme res subunit, partial [Chthonomonadales bacterium]|nr:putative type restriction enzyme res subunit [Chthonomonadales bacterium]